MQKLRTAISCGDPAGVGPEIILKWLNSNPDVWGDVCVIGHEDFLNDIPNDCDRVTIKQSARFEPGSPTVEGAKLALEALELAAAGCREGKYSSAVTAPVSKAWMVKAGFSYPGQTEFFAARWGGDPTMAFAGGKMKVVLATWHLPLMEVAKCLDVDCLGRAVRNGHVLATAFGNENPKIGVCGLNPHAGEEGILGCEERDVINPILDNLREEYKNLSSALPADTIFKRHLDGEFDVVIAMYHDQGLTPLKTLEFDQSVNITMGLPWVRTSPDHGTGFDIAGKGIANITSFSNAFNVSKRLCQVRTGVPRYF